MNSKRLHHLIYKKLDNILSATEEKELSDYLAQDIAAAELLATQRQMNDFLNKMPSVEPPEYLSSQIMASLPLPARRRVEHEPWWRRLFTAPAPLIQHRFAIGFVSGLFIGVLLAGFLLLSRSTGIIDQGSLPGTALLTRQFPQVLKIDLPSVDGEISWNSTSPERMVRLSLNPTFPVTAVFQFDPAELYVSHFYQESWANAGNVQLLPNGARIDFQKPNRFVLMLSSRGETYTPIQFKITQEDTLLYARQLHNPVGNRK